MKPYRNLPKLEEFHVYARSASELTRARVRSYEIEETLSRNQNIVSWICRIVAAAIMLETLLQVHRRT